MLLILLNILTWILIIILFVVFVVFVMWMVTGYKAKVPFVPVPDSILKDIHKIMEVKEETVVYDLGCG